MPKFPWYSLVPRQWKDGVGLAHAHTHALEWSPASCGRFIYSLIPLVKWSLISLRVEWPLQEQLSNFLKVRKQSWILPLLLREAQMMAANWHQWNVHWLHKAHPSLTVIQIRDTCMAVSPLKPYCHTNKRHMHGSQSTQALLSYK